MDLKEVMEQKDFVVVGDTLNEEKFAYKIKDGLIKNGYTVYAAGKELPSLNDVEGNVDIIDMCINPAKGLKMLKECKKPFKCIVLQPGAESAEIIEYLEKEKMPYIQNCLLIGMKMYRGYDAEK